LFSCASWDIDCIGLNTHREVFLYRQVFAFTILAAAACSQGVMTVSQQLPDSSMNDDTCQLTALDSLDVYSRPDHDASLWGMLHPGGCITISGVTADGWLGFDPGVDLHHDPLFCRA